VTTYIVLIKYAIYRKGFFKSVLLQMPLFSKKPVGQTQDPFFSSYGSIQLKHSLDFFPMQVKQELSQSLENKIIKD
jgi:hypothetical protein